MADFSICVCAAGQPAEGGAGVQGEAGAGAAERQPLPYLEGGEPQVAGPQRQDRAALQV